MLLVSSRTCDGSVGLPRTEAALRRISGHASVLTLGTVEWTGPGNHPRRLGPLLSGREMAAMLEVMLDRPERHGYGAGTIVSGYLRTTEQVEALHHALGQHPHVRLMLDPVLGDNGHLYIPEETAAAVRQLLAPRADALLPNLTEAAWLAGHGTLPNDLQETRKLAESLRRRFPRCRHLIVTSAPDGSRLGVLHSDDHGAIHVRSLPQVGRYLAGAGDYLTGAVAGAIVTGLTGENILASAFGLLASEYGLGEE